MLTISGTNFCPEADQNTVLIGQTAGQVVTASREKLVVKVSEDSTEGGALSVNVAGILAASKSTITVALDARPVMTKVSAGWLPPGNQFTISGANFGSNPDKIQLYIGQ